MNIYVGNLSHEVNEDELRAAFAKFGELTSVAIIKDKFSGEPKGFGFVEMPKKEEADAAIRGLNGTELQGKAISVNEARPREDRGQRGGRRGGKQGGYSGGRGGGRRF